MREYLKTQFGISDEVCIFAEKMRKEVQAAFQTIERTSQKNQWKVLHAFQKHHVSDTHFAATTGYGYDDAGRETLDAVYADVFGAEDALVRHTIINGTHAISLCLFAVLRPGDTVVAVTGKPYDTLEEVLGIAENQPSGSGSLKDFGVRYKQVDLSDGKVDYNNIMSTVDKNTKAVMIQKSKGYAFRPSLTCAEIGKIIRTVKEISPDIICIVDNCYGEFVEECEPTQYGADLIAGSLIKNPGGGIVPTGGYICGKKALVELAAYKLNSVGLGKHVGATLGHNKAMFQGLFMAPHIVGESVKTAVFAGCCFQKLGFKTSPAIGEYRSDIIQAIQFGTAEGLIEFCRGIQKGAPIDSFVTPCPWDMPGYADQVIMAAGAFNQGASIELSADGPIRPPYIAYMQGGLTFDSAYVGVLQALELLKQKGAIHLHV